MKRYIIMLGIMLLTVGYAHAPSDIALEFDAEQSVLIISAAHAVAKINNHYISKIHVQLNGVEIISQEFNSQSSPESQDVQYTIVDARVGDEITVTADCNIIGIKSETITVPEKTVQKEEE